MLKYWLIVYLCDDALFLLVAAQRQLLCSKTPYLYRQHVFSHHFLGLLALTVHPLLHQTTFLGAINCCRWCSGGKSTVWRTRPLILDLLTQADIFEFGVPTFISWIISGSVSSSETKPAIIIGFQLMRDFEFRLEISGACWGLLFWPTLTTPKWRNASLE